MKRKIALLICMLLLCGCNGSVSGNIPTNDIPDIIESTESAESPDTHEIVQPSAEPVQTSPAPTETTDTAETETEFDDSEWITPKLSAEKVGYTLSGGVSAETVVEYAENNAAQYDTSELQIYMTFTYIGTDDVDWLVDLKYTEYNNERSLYERLFLTKDGEVIRELDPVEDWIYGIVYSFGELYVSCQSSGLLKVDLTTGKPTVIEETDGNSTPMIVGANDSFIVYGVGEKHKIILRETGEIITTDIQWHEMADDRFILCGDKIDYVYGEPYRYDISTRTLTKGDFHNLEKIKAHIFNDKWCVIQESAPDGTELPAVRVVNLYDGTERIYDLRVLNGTPADYARTYLFLEDGDRLWIRIPDGFRGVLNLNTGEAAAIDLDHWAHYPNLAAEGKMLVYDSFGEDRDHYIADFDYPV